MQFTISNSNVSVYLPFMVNTKYIYHSFTIYTMSAYELSQKTKNGKCGAKEEGKPPVFFPSSPLVDMSWQHVAAGDLMSGKGLSDQLGVSHLQASTPSLPV